MKGLIVWAQSICRSQMALYRELGKAFDVPLVIPFWYDPTHACKRAAVGLFDEEFSELNTIFVGEDFDKGKAVLDSHPGWSHLFCNYQQSAAYRRLLALAKSRGEKVAVGGESPCNMWRGLRGLAKEFYLRAVLPRRLKETIDAAMFFVNYSGNDAESALKLGWLREKIIPFGYFPPPLPGSEFKKRTANSSFEILMTGAAEWHRGLDVAIETLSLLKRQGVSYHATITQSGPLLNMAKARAERERLPIDFVGFLPMSELVKLYETCSVYVGAGRREPWGMRLNDALNCGASLVVSRGMGGVKLVDDYGCGLTFKNEDAADLAGQLTRLATDVTLYEKCAENVVRAADVCSPEHQANMLKNQIESRFPKWME